MADQHLTYLFDRSFSGEATDSEREELARWAENAEEPELAEMLERAWGSHAPASTMPESMSRRILDTVLGQDAAAARPGGRAVRFKWWAVAAAAILLTFGGYRLWVDRRGTGTAVPSLVQANDALPGGNKATLTLAGGQHITLDSAGIGKLAQQPGAMIVKTDSGRLAYTASGGGLASAVSYNVLTTPRGGIYHIKLVDGTEVWLNSASSIRYPVAFGGDRRVVEITGEAYFEVARDASRPFHVKANDVDIQVLGTDFDINSYADEGAIRTTLLKGSVRVIRGDERQLLEPGQQSAAGATLGLNRHADLEAVMAWKNGRFHFDHTPLSAVLRQLSRWYDVDVEYRGAIGNKTVGGEMGRNLNLSEVLNGLKYIGVNFTIEGKKLIVMP